MVSVVILMNLKSNYSADMMRTVKDVVLGRSTKGVLQNGRLKKSTAAAAGAASSVEGLGGLGPLLPVAVGAGPVVAEAPHARAEENSPGAKRPRVGPPVAKLKLYASKASPSHLTYATSIEDIGDLVGKLKLQLDDAKARRTLLIALPAKMRVRTVANTDELLNWGACFRSPHIDGGLMSLSPLTPLPLPEAEAPGHASDAVFEGAWQTDPEQAALADAPGTSTTMLQGSQSASALAFP